MTGAITTYDDVAHIVKTRYESTVPYLPILTTGEYLELLMTNFCIPPAGSRYPNWGLHSIVATVTGHYLITFHRKWSE